MGTMVQSYQLSESDFRGLRFKQEDGRFDDWSSLLFDQATLADGGKLEDPVGFVRRMNDLLLASSH